MKIYCRLITPEYTESTGSEIITFVTDRLATVGISHIAFDPFIPYWKREGCGELSFQFDAQESLEKIQLLFADTWQANAADAKWSNIICPAVSFLWISV